MAEQLKLFSEDFSLSNQSDKEDAIVKDSKDNTFNGSNCKVRSFNDYIPKKEIDKEAANRFYSISDHLE